MSTITQFRFPVDIRFGTGAREALGEFAQSYSVNRPLLVTDPGLGKTEAFGLIDEEMKCTWGKDYFRFTDVHPNPTDKDVENAWKAYVEGNCDGVVGLGGGSVLDTARAMRLKVAFGDISLTEMPFDSLPARLTPFCAIPTTAGTGSEVGQSSVIIILELGGKRVFGARQLMADIAVLDPELTMGLPKHLTAATGMDAMTHAVEAFVCPIFHPMCDAIALEAIRFVRLYLPRACADGTDIEARGMMQLAASMGAVAFQKDLGAAHSLSHPLSSEFGIQHGLANAIALPAVVRFNGEQDSTLYARVVSALGLNANNDPAQQVVDFLDEFNRSIGITQKLRDLKVPENKLPLLASKAIQDVCHQSNPRQCTEADMLRLYKEIW